MYRQEFTFLSCQHHTVSFVLIIMPQNLSGVLLVSPYIVRVDFINYRHFMLRNIRPMLKRKTHQEWDWIPQNQGAARVASTRVLGSSTKADLRKEEYQTTLTNVCLMKLIEKIEIN